MEKISKGNKVIYNGEVCTFTWSAGKGWKEPKDGLRFVVINQNVKVYKYENSM